MHKFISDRPLVLPARMKKMSKKEKFFIDQYVKLIEIITDCLTIINSDWQFKPPSIRAHIFCIESDSSPSVPITSVLENMVCLQADSGQWSVTSSF